MKIRTEKEAAALLGISARTLQRWRAEGGGPSYVRISDRRLGYPEDSLRQFSAARTFSSRAAELAQAAA